MSWASVLVGIVTVIYLGAAIAYWLEENPGMALAFGAYALANVGLIIAGQA